MYTHFMGVGCECGCADGGEAAPGLGTASVFAPMNPAAPAVELIPEAQTRQRQTLDDFTWLASMLSLLLNLTR